MARSKQRFAGHKTGHVLLKKTNASNVPSQLSVAVQYQRDGRFAEAQAVYSRMLAANPRDFVVLNNLGLIASDQGRDSDAEVLFRQSASLNNSYLMPLMNLGNLFQNQKKYSEATSYYEQALRVDPGFSPLYVNLGNLLTAQGNFKEGLASYHRALAISPDLAEGHLNLGNTLVRLGQSAEAVQHYERARSLQPGNAGAHIYLGVALLNLGEIDRAKASLQQALQIAPDNIDALVNLGTVFTALGWSNESVQCCRRALQLGPDHPAAQSNLLSSLNYCDSFAPVDVAQESLRIGEAMERRFSATWPRHRNESDPGRRLRIGYVSPDFRKHAVAFFLEPLFHHDRGAVEIFCYAEVARPDRITERFQSAADHWFSTVGITDDDLAARIREDGIDILIDLAGHTNHNRLPVFARRPAPVQMTWLGYPNTTGLKSIDYRLVDAITDQPGVADPLASETLFRLDDCFLCYNPPEWAPTPMPPPSADNGFVTFGSFNNLAKLSDACLHLWGRLLSSMPSARLLLKSRLFVAEDSKTHILARLHKHGVTTQQIILLGPSGDADQLAAYHQVDIALDSCPYNGTTTTFEALWMGVPVVTLAGESHCGRVGMSLLTNMGLPDLIARDHDDYIRIAGELAGDPVRLARLRQELRGRMAASPLCDASAFARKLEAVYRTVWKRWCATESPVMKADATPVEALAVRLSNGIVLAVPPSLEAFTTYVALEQEAWFEKEADFPALWLKPGMTAIEIGANLGVYSLPMARAVGPSGHVIAYEPGSAAADLLEHSRNLNELANLTVVRAALSDRSRMGHLLHGYSSEVNKLSETGLGERVSITCLDDEDRLRNWNTPDFVKIDAEGEEERILRGGIGFFTRHSPLVMFEVDNDAKANLPTYEAFRSLGYRLYRLLAGAPVLVPDNGDILDAYELNLFAAKPDRAAALAQDGWLVEDLPNWQPNEIDRQTALQLLRQVPSMAAFADLSTGSRPLDASYRDCLAGFAAWRSPDLALPARCAALEFALAGLVALTMQVATLPRLLTLARVAQEAGKRALSVQALCHFLNEAKPGMLRLEEPFWPPGVRFDRLMPTGPLEDWIIGSVTEQIELSGHHSSFYTGLTPGLTWMSTHGFGSAEMERRSVLVHARAGEKTEIPQRLLTSSADHLNAALWQAGRVPGTSMPQPVAQAPAPQAVGPVASQKPAILASRLINVALNRPALQSSTSEWSQPNDAGRAVSGTRTGAFAFCTAIEAEPFWSVDLKSDFALRRITIFNREDSDPDRACPLIIETSADAREWREISVVKYVFGGAATGTPLDLCFKEPIPARYVRLRRTGGPRHFHLDQVEIHASVDDIQSHARVGEDLWVLRMTGGRSGGTFVEIGASDGVSVNNTYLLEKRFGWRGVCVEPNPAFYQKLVGNRTARTFQRAVFRNSGEKLEFVPLGDVGTLVGFEASDIHASIRQEFMKLQTIQVETITATDLLVQGELPPLIDFLSLDTEGTEWDILESIDFSQYNFGLMTIEHNYAADKREMIYKKLKQLGYNRFDADFDDWYYHPVYLKALNKGVHVDFDAVLSDYRIRAGFGKEAM